MISFEVFAAKDPESGVLQGILMSVPLNCGLSQADTLRLHDAQLLAIEKGTVLPVDFPPVDTATQKDLEETIRLHGAIVVAEFSARGIAENYLLKLVSADATSTSSAYGVR